MIKAKSTLECFYNVMYNKKKENKKWSIKKKKKKKKRVLNQYTNLEKIVPQSHLYSLVPQVLEWAFQSD